MNFFRKIKFLFAALLLSVVFHPGAAFACSACYGDPNSGLSKGLLWGIFVLLGVVLTVLGGITTFFVYLSKKSAASGGSALAKDGVTPGSTEKA